MTDLVEQSTSVRRDYASCFTPCHALAAKVTRRFEQVKERSHNSYDILRGDVSALQSELDLVRGVYERLERQHSASRSSFDSRLREGQHSRELDEDESALTLSHIYGEDPDTVRQDYDQRTECLRGRVTEINSLRSRIEADLKAATSKIDKLWQVVDRGGRRDATMVEQITDTFLGWLWSSPNRSTQAQYPPLVVRDQPQDENLTPSQQGLLNSLERGYVVGSHQYQYRQTFSLPSPVPDSTHSISVPNGDFSGTLIDPTPRSQCNQLLFEVQLEGHTDRLIEHYRKQASRHLPPSILVSLPGVSLPIPKQADDDLVVDGIRVPLCFTCPEDTVRIFGQRFCLQSRDLDGRDRELAQWVRSQPVSADLFDQISSFFYTDLDQAMLDTANLIYRNTFFTCRFSSSFRRQRGVRHIRPSGETEFSLVDRCEVITTQLLTPGRTDVVGSIDVEMSWGCKSKLLQVKVSRFPVADEEEDEGASTTSGVGARSATTTTT